MIVAFVKAGLVCAYFMHLRYDNRYHLFVFVSTILFVSIFFTFTLFDLESRDRILDQQDTFFRRGDGSGACPGDPSCWSDEQRLKKPRPVEAAEGAAAEGGGDQKGGGDVQGSDTKAAADAKAGDGKADAKQPGG
jgi:cytochrome c oxidase subunit 4